MRLLLPLAAFSSHWQTCQTPLSKTRFQVTKSDKQSLLFANAQLKRASDIWYIRLLLGGGMLCSLDSGPTSRNSTKAVSKIRQIYHSYRPPKAKQTNNWDYEDHNDDQDRNTSAKQDWLPVSIHKLLGRRHRARAAPDQSRPFSTGPCPLLYNRRSAK